MAAERQGAIWQAAPEVKDVTDLFEGLDQVEQHNATASEMCLVQSFLYSHCLAGYHFAKSFCPMTEYETSFDAMQKQVQFQNSRVL